jgi:hypothetical protein
MLFSGGGRPGPLQGRRTVVHDDDVPLRCATCGRELQGDRDDDPFSNDGPTCGECRRDHPPRPYQLACH